MGFDPKELAELVVTGRGDGGVRVGLTDERGAGLEDPASSLCLAGPDGRCLGVRLPLDAALTPRDVQRHYIMA
jgi:hypothetical protein